MSCKEMRQHDEIFCFTTRCIFTKQKGILKDCNYLYINCQSLTINVQIVTVFLKLQLFRAIICLKMYVILCCNEFILNN